MEEKLRTFGLTKVQARVFVALLQNGHSSARLLSMQLKMNRVQIYQVLRSLQKRGIVERTMESPFVFNPVDPEIALRSLIEEKKAEIEKIAESSSQLTRDLYALEPAKLEVDLHPGNQFFKTVSNVQVVNVLKHEIMRANKFIYRVVPGEHFLIWSREGIHIEEKKAIRKGIEVKIVTELIPRNAKLVKEYAKYAEIRTKNRLSDYLRFALTESKVLVTFNPETKLVNEMAAILTNNNSLISGFKHDFENLWELSSVV